MTSPNNNVLLQNSAISFWIYHDLSNNSWILTCDVISSLMWHGGPIEIICGQLHVVFAIVMVVARIQLTISTYPTHHIDISNSPHRHIQLTTSIYPSHHIDISTSPHRHIHIDISTSPHRHIHITTSHFPTFYKLFFTKTWHNSKVSKSP